ncbi:MAG TPA: glycosyltransferase family 9 protein [Chloroflexota bacterium]|nr:glycosyltransferase family 9 protein [Chloroflexota bacterium]
MVSRILVLRPGAIGDTLVTLPAIQALRQRFPSAKIEMAGNPAALPLLASSNLVDRCLAFDDPRVTRLFVAGAPLADDPFLGLDSAVAWCADPDGVLARALTARGASQVVVAPSRPPPGRQVHVARHLVETLRPLGIELADPLELPSLRSSTGSERQAREELLALGLKGRAFVAVHPGSGSPTKNWPAERFAAVIDALEERYGMPSLVLGGPADAETVARLGAATRNRSLVLLDRPLGVVAAVLRRARAFLGNDSGLSHLAGLLGVPTLALFGPTDPVVWSPLGPRVRVVRSEPLAVLTVERVHVALASLCATSVSEPGL